MSYLDLIRRSAAPPAAPDAVVSPADHDEVGARPAGVLRARRGGRAVRRRDVRCWWCRPGARRVRGRDRAGPRAAGPTCRGRRRLLDRDAPGRPDRPARRGAAGRARVHARPRPAVVRARDDRRLRGDALGRAAVDRLGALRRARRTCTGCHAVRRPRARPRAGQRRGAGPQAAGPGLGGRVRRRHRGHGPGPAGPGGAAPRGLARRRPGVRAGDAADARAARAAAGPRAAERRGRDRDGRRDRRRRDRRRRRLPAAGRLGGLRGRRGAPGGRGARRSCAPRARRRSAPGPPRPGSTGASARRACATSCSAPGC